MLGFTFAAVGTIVGLVVPLTAQDESTRAQPVPDRLLAGILLVFASFLILVAVVQTLAHKRQIAFTARYIREEIEPRVPGLGWETYWANLRQSVRFGRVEPLAVYYIGLNIGVLGTWIATGTYKELWSLPVPVLASTGMWLGTFLYSRGTRVPRREPDPGSHQPGQ